jgi:LEM3 (ligand-effect modulator 3) family / CDC50 family
MRTAGLPNFRKLYGKIENDILPGTYVVTIENNYDVNGFDGNKSFVLSTTNALGGKNYFLAVCYIVVGSLCLIFAVIFLVAFLKKKNVRRLDWAVLFVWLIEFDYTKHLSTNIFSYKDILKAKAVTFNSGMKS